jgi:hypothetical protein
VLIEQYERNSKQLHFILNQINLISYSYHHSMKKYLPRFFKFYQPKATGGGFLIFEWTLPVFKFLSNEEMKPIWKEILKIEE